MPLDGAESHAPAMDPLSGTGQRPCAGRSFRRSGVVSGAASSRHGTTAAAQVGGWKSPPVIADSHAAHEIGREKAGEMVDAT